MHSGRLGDIQKQVFSYSDTGTNVDGLISDLSKFDLVRAIQLATNVDAAWSE